MDLDLLSDDQLDEFADQNKLLTEGGEEPVSVAEYLKCRLDDAIGELRNSTPDARAAKLLAIIGFEIKASLKRERELRGALKDIKERMENV